MRFGHGHSILIAILIVLKRNSSECIFCGGDIGQYKNAVIFLKLEARYCFFSYLFYFFLLPKEYMTLNYIFILKFYFRR